MFADPERQLITFHHSLQLLFDDLTTYFDTGHKAIDCENKRVLDFGSVPNMSADEAWEKMRDAEEQGDSQTVRQCFFAYCKAITADTNADGIDLVDLEEGFRKDQRITHIIGTEPLDLRKDQVIVGFDGTPGKTYVVDIVLRAKDSRPKRRLFAKRMAETNEDNLERLKDAGMIQSRGVPLCSNCLELGHVKKHCKEEKAQVQEGSRCANCGEASHRLRDCKAERVSEEAKKAASAECRRCNEGKFGSSCSPSTSILNCNSWSLCQRLPQQSSWWWKSSLS